MKRLMIILSAIFFPIALCAQNLFETESSRATETFNSEIFCMNGYTRGSVFGNGNLYDLSSVFAEISLQNSLNYGKAFLKSDIRLRKGMFFDEEKLIVQPKELYAGFGSFRFDALFGYQIVNWGRTDGFNPTNNIIANDYFFLSSDPDDQKQSNLMLRLKYRFTPHIELDLIGIPFYSASNYRFDLFKMGENVFFEETVLPSRNFENGSLAFRLNFELPALGWSVSYFNGYDPFHGYDVQKTDWSQGYPKLSNAAIPYRKTTIGADVAFPLGNLIFRAEAAYNITKNPDNRMYIPATDVGYVVAIETQISDVSLICQYIGKIIPNFTALGIPNTPTSTDPLVQLQNAKDIIQYENRKMNRLIFNQQDRMNNAVSLILMKPFYYETLNAEISAYYNFSSNDWLIRPKIVWKISDALSTTLGGNYMKGKDASLFTYTTDILSGVFAELKVSF